MKVLFLNGDGGGFAGWVEVSEGTTIMEFLRKNLSRQHSNDDDDDDDGGGDSGPASPNDFLVKVNRQPVPADYVLQDGDRVTATMKKIEGA